MSRAKAALDQPAEPVVVDVTVDRVETFLARLADSGIIVGASEIHTIYCRERGAQKRAAADAARELRELREMTASTFARALSALEVPGLK